MSARAIVVGVISAVAPADNGAEEVRTMRILSVGAAWVAYVAAAVAFLVLPVLGAFVEGLGF